MLKIFISMNEFPGENDYPFAEIKPYDQTIPQIL
jgi:hypothetical protein